jgi:uncharacterized protein
VFSPGSIPAAVLGGSLIGLSASLMLALNGRVLGVSGLAAGLVARGTSDRLLRAVFIAGMLLGGVGIGLAAPAALPGALTSDYLLLITAGLLVGFGTRLGSGCTSGHGVCGMARLSIRSLIATPIFMITAMATVYLMKHVIGVAP